MSGRESSRVSLRLSRRPVFEGSGDPFQPMGLPNELRVEHGEALWHGLEEVRTDFEIELESGRTALPLSQGEPCVIDVPPGCTIRGHLVATRSRGARDGCPVVTELSLDIDPPIVFKNIFETLLEVHRTFEDRTLKAFLEALDESLAGGLLERNGELRRLQRIRSIPASRSSRHMATAFFAARFVLGSSMISMPPSGIFSEIPRENRVLRSTSFGRTFE